MVVLHPSHAPYVYKLPPSRGNVEHNVQLDPGASLFLTVVSDERPEINAGIDLKLRNPHNESDQARVLSLFNSALRSDSEGRASVAHLCEGEWVVDVGSADRQRFASRLVTVSGAEPLSVKISLDEARWIAEVELPVRLVHEFERLRAR